MFVTSLTQCQIHLPAYTYLQTTPQVIHDPWSQGSRSSNAKHLKGEKEKQDKLEDSSSHRKTTKK